LLKVKKKAISVGTPWHPSKTFKEKSDQGHPALDITDEGNSYKNRYEAPQPGNFIRMKILDELKLSIAKASEIFGVSCATLSNLVNRKSNLSAEMALRIEKAFGVSMDTLLRMQAW